MKNEKEYSIGLDIGNTSIGFACIDNDNRVIRFKNKHMWGTRLLDAPKSEVERAYHRGLRRTYIRRKERLNMVDDIFFDEIIKIDSNFFERLQESFRVSSDIDHVTGKDNRYILFDGNLTDIDYYKRFPTIYHLRNYLMTTNEKVDIRFIYLAVHHIIKYRGHFLYEGNIADIDSLDILLARFFDALSALSDIEFSFKDKLLDIVNILNDNSIPNSIANNIKSKNPGLKTKEDLICNMFCNSKEKLIIRNIVKAVLGGQFDVFITLNLDRNDNDLPKINFSTNYIEEKTNLMEVLGNEFKILELLEQIYNSYTFNSLINGEKFISHSMIKKYEKHKEDLVILKKMIKNFDKTNSTNYYNQTFRENIKGNYATYVKNQQNIKHDITNERYSKVSKEEFYSFIKNLIKIIPDCQEKIYIEKEMMNGQFMPKLNEYENSVIPNQFNYVELELILNKQARYHKFLKDNKDKILTIFKFKRPNYVGVLSTNSVNSWTKDETGKPLYDTTSKINPWDFYEKIDKNSIAEQFILTRVRKCKYYEGEEVLPKNSIYYQSFNCLNELNKIRIKCKPITKDLKLYLFSSLFCKKKTVTKKALVKQIMKFDVSLYGSITENSIDGLSGSAFNSTMSTLYDFKRILKKQFDISNIEMYEKIIRILSIFYDKGIREEMIQKIGNFPKSVLHEFVRLDYSGWGNFSSKLICGVKNSKGNTILDELYSGCDKYNYCYNFTQLINEDENEFKYLIPDINQKITGKISLTKDIQTLLFPKQVKTLLWQCVQIVQEIEQIIGNKPKYIYIESIHSDELKVQSFSRYKHIEQLYKSIRKNNITNIDYVYNQLLEFKEQPEQLSNDKLYLYFLQLGKCMYTGAQIDLTNLLNYEIDHVIPRAFIRDDTISNKVLVRAMANQYKASSLTLSDNIIKQMRPYWNMLLEYKLINQKKYDSLTREEFADNIFEHYLNRQLCETGQTVKALTSLLERKYGYGHVFGVRSSIIHQLRMEQMIKGEYGFAKIRDLNDMHHAKDAYLAAVIGLFMTETYPYYVDKSICKNIKNEIIELSKNNGSVMELNDLINKRNGAILTMMEYSNPQKSHIVNKNDGQLLNQRFYNILYMMKCNDCIVSKKIDGKANAAFYNETIYPKEVNPKLIPLRYVLDKDGNKVALNPALYGGYKSEKSEYFLIIKYYEIKSKKKIEKYELINVPVKVAYDIRNNTYTLTDYLNNYYDSPVVVKKLYKNQLIRHGGQLIYLISQNEANNATQLIFNCKYDLLLYFATNKVNSEELKNIYDKIKESELDVEFVKDYIKKLDKCYPLFKNAKEKISQFFYSEGEISYKNLTFEQRLDFISKLLIITKTGGSRIDMPQEYGGGSSLGRIYRLSIDFNNFTIINQSITGLYEIIEKPIDNVKNI